MNRFTHWPIRIVRKIRNSDTYSNFGGLAVFLRGSFMEAPSRISTNFLYSLDILQLSRNFEVHARDFDHRLRWPAIKSERHFTGS